MKTPTPEAACGYVRGSTADQLTTLESQAAQITRYFEARGMGMVPPPEHLRAISEARLVKAFEKIADKTQMDRILALPFFIDTDSSAYKVPFYEREIAAGMIAFMQEEGIRNVGFAKLDRVFRKQLDCLFTMEDLRSRQIAVHLLDLQMDTSTPIGQAMVGMLSIFAQLENGFRSARQKETNSIRKTTRMTCGHAPYGWEAVSKDAPMIPVEHEQQILFRLVHGDLAACSCNEAARRLNAAQIPAKNGGQWYGATVAKLRADPRFDSARLQQRRALS